MVDLLKNPKFLWKGLTGSLWKKSPYIKSDLRSQIFNRLTFEDPKEDDQVQKLKGDVMQLERYLSNMCRQLCNYLGLITTGRGENIALKTENQKLKKRLKLFTGFGGMEIQALKRELILKDEECDRLRQELANLKKINKRFPEKYQEDIRKTSGVEKEEPKNLIQFKRNVLKVKSQQMAFENDSTTSEEKNHKVNFQPIKENCIKASNNTDKRSILSKPQLKAQSAVKVGQKGIHNRNIRANNEKIGSKCVSERNIVRRYNEGENSQTLSNKHLKVTRAVKACHKTVVSKPARSLDYLLSNVEQNDRSDGKLNESHQEKNILYHIMKNIKMEDICNTKLICPEQTYEETPQNVSLKQKVLHHHTLQSSSKKSLDTSKKLSKLKSSAIPVSYNRLIRSNLKSPMLSENDSTYLLEDSEFAVAGSTEKYYSQHLITPSTKKPRTCKNRGEMK